MPTALNGRIECLKAGEISRVIDFLIEGLYCSLILKILDLSTIKDLASIADKQSDK